MSGASARADVELKNSIRPDGAGTFSGRRVGRKSFQIWGTVRTDAELKIKGENERCSFMMNWSPGD